MSVLADHVKVQQLPLVSAMVGDGDNGVVGNSVGDGNVGIGDTVERSTGAGVGVGIEVGSSSSSS